MTKFNSKQYNTGSANKSFDDPSDRLAGSGRVIGFYHLPSKKYIYFKAFITAFNETYSPDWAAETVFGRADPIYMFKNTQRRITLAFKVPASTDSEAYENLGKAQKLIQFLYPGYGAIAGDVNALTISQSPLVRLSLMNVVQKAQPAATNNTNATDIYNSYTATGVIEDGLLGIINNLTINHNLENTDAGVIEKSTGETVTILPKLLEINLDFSPIHEHTVGWTQETNQSTDFASFAEPNFPYGARLAEDSMGQLEIVKPAEDAEESAGAAGDTAAADSAEADALEDLLRRQREWGGTNWNDMMAERDARTTDP